MITNNYLDASTLIKIFAYATACKNNYPEQVLLRLSEVCKNWNQLANDDSLWKPITLHYSLRFDRDAKGLKAKIKAFVHTFFSISNMPQEIGYLTLQPEVKSRLSTALISCRELKMQDEAHFSWLVNHPCFRGVLTFQEAKQILLKEKNSSYLMWIERAYLKFWNNKNIVEKPSFLTFARPHMIPSYYVYILFKLYEENQIKFRPLLLGNEKEINSIKDGKLRIRTLPTLFSPLRELTKDLFEEKYQAIKTYHPQLEDSMIHYLMSRSDFCGHMSREEAEQRLINWGCEDEKERCLYFRVCYLDISCIDKNCYLLRVSKNRPNQLIVSVVVWSRSEYTFVHYCVEIPNQMEPGSDLKIEDVILRYCLSLQPLEPPLKKRKR